MEKDDKNKPSFAPSVQKTERAKRALEMLPSAPHNHDFPPSSLLVLSIIYHVGQALSMGFYKFFCEKFIFLTLFFGRFHRKYSPSPQKNAVQNCLFHNILLPHRFLTPFVGIPPLLCSVCPLFRVLCPVLSRRIPRFFRPCPATDARAPKKRQAARATARAACRHWILFHFTASFATPAVRGDQVFGVISK